MRSTELAGRAFIDSMQSPTTIWFSGRTGFARIDAEAFAFAVFGAVF